MECDPGRSDQPELEEVPDGEDGAGQAMLPLERTSSPVDIDLINNIMRLPYRTRLAILINEFGTALAGRGSELNEVIHRANPALRETDEVLKILAGQNRTLARLAADGDQALGPARARARARRQLHRPGERDGPGLGRAARRAGGDLPEAAALPRGAEADDGAAGRALRRDDARHRATSATPRRT